MERKSGQGQNLMMIKMKNIFILFFIKTNSRKNSEQERMKDPNY